MCIYFIMDGLYFDCGYNEVQKEWHWYLWFKKRECCCTGTLVNPCVTFFGSCFQLSCCWSMLPPGTWDRLWHPECLRVEQGIPQVLGGELWRPHPTHVRRLPGPNRWEAVPSSPRPMPVVHRLWKSSRTSWPCCARDTMPALQPSENQEVGQWQCSIPPALQDNLLDSLQLLGGQKSTMLHLGAGGRLWCAFFVRRPSDSKAEAGFWIKIIAHHNFPVSAVTIYGLWLKGLWYWVGHGMVLHKRMFF